MITREMSSDMVDAFLLIRRNQLFHMKPAIEHSIQSHTCYYTSISL